MATRLRSLFDAPLFLIFQLFSLMAIKGVASIGCFVCSSFNGSNPSCEDTFNSTIQLGSHVTPGAAYYQYPCWAFKKQRQGLFPADHCIKVNGYRSDEPSQTMVIRTCALDSGTLTADTEIVRISHCGHFKYEGYQYSGCVQACDTDGCNAATGHPPCAYLVVLLPILSLLATSSNSCLDAGQDPLDVLPRPALHQTQPSTRPIPRSWCSLIRPLLCLHLMKLPFLHSHYVQLNDIT